MFEVGQEVWCLLNGKGKVVSIKKSYVYEVFVIFHTGGEIAYTTDGFLDVDHVHRSLYFSEPVVRGAKKPVFVPTLEGKKVLVELPCAAGLYFWDVTCETEDKIYAKSGDYCMKKDVSIYEIQEVTFKE